MQSLAAARDCKGRTEPPASVARSASLAGFDQYMKTLKIDSALLDTLSAQAKANPRLRQAYDLRTTPEDNSQRILNAMEPGTILPIHRHRGSTETVVVLRGKIRQNFYDENGQLTESFEASAESEIAGFSVELGRWHNTECLESGTVILECKDGRYEPLSDEDIMN